MSSYYIEVTGETHLSRADQTTLRPTGELNKNHLCNVLGGEGNSYMLTPLRRYETSAPKNIVEAGKRTALAPK